jgi:hypothetical protein
MVREQRTSDTATPSSRFRVGDWVSFLYGPRKVRAQVIEDRGPLGVHGRRIYRVRVDVEDGESARLEQLEEDLESAEAPESTNPLLNTTLEHLRQGRQFTKISPERYNETREPKVAFHFSDGSGEVLPSNATTWLLCGGGRRHRHICAGWRRHSETWTK